MADNPQTLALIVLAQQYAGNIVRQSNRTSSTLRMIPIVVGEGKNCAWVAESTGQLAEAYAEGADAANYGSDAQTSAILSWAEYRSNFRVTGLARAAARTTTTPEGNVQLWVRNLINSSAALMSKVNQEIFAGAVGDTPPEIEGFGNAIADDANTYATIARGSNAFWKPTVVDPGVATALSLSQIRDDLSKIYIASGENADLAACSPAVFNEVVKLFESTRRYMQMVDRVTTARGQVTLDAGYRAVEVDGCVFYKDKDSTANRIHYLNSNHVRLEVLPQAEVPALMPGTMLQGNDGFGPIPLMLNYEMLSTTGDSKKAEVRFYGQLVVDKPNAFGARKNVLTA